MLGALAFFRVRWDDGPELIPRFPVAEWIAALPNHFGWVAVFVACMAAQPALRALVWRRMLPDVPTPPIAPQPQTQSTQRQGAQLQGAKDTAPRAPRPPAPWRTCFHALTLGGLVHNVIPGRMGLAASALVLRRWTSLPFTALLSSLLVVKLAELAALILAAAVSVWVVETRFGGAGLLGRMVLAGAAGLVVLAGAAWGVAYGAPWLAGRLLVRHGRDKHPRLLALVEALGHGFAVLRSAPHIGQALLLAVAPMAAGAIGFGAGVWGCGAPSGILGGPLVLAAITFGQFTPGLPVGMGVHYFVCAWAARQLGVSAADAAALAALSHAATAVTHLLLGSASAVTHRDTLRALVRLRRGGAKSAKSGTMLASAGTSSA